MCWRCVSEHDEKAIRLGKVCKGCGVLLSSFVVCPRCNYPTALSIKKFEKEQKEII